MTARDAVRAREDARKQQKTAEPDLKDISPTINVAPPKVDVRVSADTIFRTKRKNEPESEESEEPEADG